MQKVKLSLSRNDHIVHAAHGVGVVAGVVTKNLGGDKHAFYKVKTEKLTYWLPVMNSHTNRIRPIRSSSSFRNAVSLIRRKPKKMSNNFRVRLKYINNELAKCSLTATARLIRDLHARNANKPLHVNESRTFDKQKQQFINEWSLAAGMPINDAESRLEDALSASVLKIDRESK